MDNGQRYEELYQQAVLTYLDKTDFNVTEWLDEEDATEFIKLMEELGLK